MAMALFQEIIESGPNQKTLLPLQGGCLKDLFALAEVFSRIALHDAAGAEQHTSMNEALTAAAREAYVRIPTRRPNRSSFYTSSKLTIAHRNLAFAMGSVIPALELNPALFAPGMGDDIADAKMMIESACSIMPCDDTKQGFILRIGLLVAASVLDLRSGRANPEDVIDPHKGLRVRPGYTRPLGDFKPAVYAAARVIVTRVPI